jgi:hypothetical protein
MHAENHPCISRRGRLARLLSVALIVALPVQVARAAESPGARPEVDDQGIAHVPATAVPPSRFMSPEARAKFIQLFAHPEPSPPPGSEVRLMREFDERKNAPFVARARALYPVDIEPRLIGGVHTRVITPKAGVAARNRDRVLVNLHGGGFLWGEGNGALTESIAIAGVGRHRNALSRWHRTIWQFAGPAWPEYGPGRVDSPQSHLQSARSAADNYAQGSSP